MRTYIGLFDLDQWMCAGGSSNSSTTLYTLDEAETPPEMLQAREVGFSPFWCVFGLAEHMDGSDVLRVWVDPASVRAFLSSDVVGRDQDDPGRQYWRGNMSFTSRVLLATGIVPQVDFYGVQQQALANLATHGATAIANPRELFEECVSAGLIARELARGLDPDVQRGALLELSMIYDLLCVVQAYIRSEGPLEPIFRWMWTAFKRLQALKNTVMCPDLFCGRHLDTRHMDSLFRKISALGTLKSTFQVGSVLTAVERRRHIWSFACCSQHFSRHLEPFFFASIEYS